MGSVSKNRDVETSTNALNGTNATSRHTQGEAPINLMEKIERNGNEWQKNNIQVINSSTIIRFIKAFCAEYGGDCVTIDKIARQIYKITPDTREHLTELCKRGLHAPNGCEGAGCTCECHEGVTA